MSNGTSTDASTTDKTRDWYRRYYNERGIGRNDLLRNPEVLFQVLAGDSSVIRALGDLEIDFQAAKVLDVGCGSGGSLFNFVRLGFPQSNLHGVDLLQERILLARKSFPGIGFASANATSMSFQDDVFDIVFESTMFVQVTDEILASRIAKEMLRITRPGGYVILSDWRYSKPASKEYKGLSRKRICSLFEVGRSARIRAVYRGALIPPVGRFLSRFAHSLYFAVQRLFPFLVGQRVVVLQKSKEVV